MSSSRNNVASGRPFKPSLASDRLNTRSPLTPRVAPHTAQSARNGQISTPRLKQQTDVNDEQEPPYSGDNVTPRSAKRRSRVESSNNTPTQMVDAPHISRASTVSPMLLAGNGNPSLNSLTLSRPTPTRSPMSDTGLRLAAPFVRSPTGSEVHTRVDDDMDARFFHASEIMKVDVEVKKPEVRRPAAFFYADGQQEQTPSVAANRSIDGRQEQQSSRTASPTRSVAGKSRHSAETSGEALAKSPPMLSPAMSNTGAASPFFPAEASRKPRSPSPSKDNIHLSYRKGVSQIFGSRPSPIPAIRTPQGNAERRPSFQRAYNAHKKSPSLSSIDSEITNASRRRSNTAQETLNAEPLREEDAGSHTVPQSSAADRIPSLHAAAEGIEDAGSLSPTRAISDLAADARRERKVLDLEISNSSLLAINASLEREIRRQKAELKRFRRLSRAGRFSTEPLDARRGSTTPGLHHDDELDVDQDFAEFGPASGLSELYDDVSDSDEDSSVTSAEPGISSTKLDRLAKDDQRLRADLEKHRELLVQSQMMNQSIRRCMYATEEMIAEGRKAVEYKVRVSDVRLGGRILTGHEEEDDNGDSIQDIEIEDEFDTLSLASPMSNDGVQDHAEKFIELWGGIGVQSNDASQRQNQLADRDSGIEMDKPAKVEALA